MKPEPGLHKQVSSIFDGVKIPGSDSQGNDSTGPRSQSLTGMDMDRTGSTSLPVDEKSLHVPVDSNNDAPAAERPVINNSAGNTHSPAGNANSQTSQDFEVQKITPPAIGSKITGKISAYLNDEDPEKARQKKMTVLVTLLFLVFISILAYAFKSPGSVNAKNNEEIVLNIKKEIVWTKPDLLSEDMRDPMNTRPRENLVEEVEKPKQDYSKFVVTGIVQGFKGNSAIVSSKVLFEGEEIFGATVVRINSDSVEFEMNGQKWTQPLKK